MITDGILNINKPQNMTSHDVVSIVRRTLGIKRVGHTGTLDPMATGVLPICVGKSTRVIEYLDLDIKKYRCTMVLGIETDTQDIWGKVLNEKSTDGIDEQGIHDAFTPFQGVIEQTPPIYSALKVDGKKLYEYAREGKTVEIKSRKIFIKSLTIDEISLDASTGKTVTFTVECSKGTYIRSICQDVGLALGCYGTMTGLVRLASGIFTIEDAVDLETLSNLSREKIDGLFMPTNEPLIHFGKVVTDKVNAIKFASGWHLSLNDCQIIKGPQYETEPFYLPIREEYKKAYNVFGIIDDTETFMGVAFYNETYKKLVADKVFYTR